MLGQRFGKLEVVEDLGYSKGFTAWLCRCDCGRTVKTRRLYLIKGTKTSCGCEPRKLDYTKRLNAVLIDTPSGTMHAAAAARKYGLPANVVYRRKAEGWPKEALLIGKQPSVKFKWKEDS
jgi:hypothetical protein